MYVPKDAYLAEKLLVVLSVACPGIGLLPTATTSCAYCVGKEVYNHVRGTHHTSLSSCPSPIYSFVLLPLIHSVV
jgi:hypothetical protein